jgi:c-di-GMP-binding flagellar brake protein YcgR
MAGIHPEEKQYFKTWDPLPPAGIKRLLVSAEEQQENIRLVVPGSEWYSSIVQQNMPHILLDYPLEMQDGEPLTVNALPVLWTRKLDGFQYGFWSSVKVHLSPKDNKLALVIHWPDRLYRTQRRAAFRVPIPVKDAGSLRLGLPEGMEYNGFIEDLSLTGMCASLRVTLEATPVIELGARVGLLFFLTGEPHAAEAVVVRALKLGTPTEHASGMERLQLALRFVEPQRLTKSLQPYIFAQQRHLARQ